MAPATSPYLGPDRRLIVRAGSGPPITLVPRSWPTGRRALWGRASLMRMFFGIIIGFALTVAGAYVADSSVAPGAEPMVNWKVVGKNIDAITTMAREGWR